ncbi:dienelactone hydrolase family protein [Actinomadura atramentaria]|uniref:dienelactone hydrolase family protein n=1 Tax=Actinomadura atramentaria TaxID=1990 RepID=UPI00036C8807|nr:dienelactone hydrolase family protein [Actinomadura atramentaria]
MLSKRGILGALAGGAVAVGCLTAPAHAAGFEKGPDPTTASVTADRGSYDIAQVDVPKGSGTGFADGTIYYPKSTADGTFGAVAVIPGFLEPKSAIDWYGPRLASQGFVVMTLDTTSVFDTPDSRGGQLLAALDYLTSKSTVKDRIDPNRLAVVGHSMGGGGTLSAAANRPNLKAAVALAPWHVSAPLTSVKTPTMIFGSDNDFIAPDGTFAKPFYDGISNAPEKAYVRLKNAGHMAYVFPDKRIAEYTLSWLKRYVDDDTRYTQFLCPGPTNESTIAAYKSTCPM